MAVLIIVRESSCRRVRSALSARPHVLPRSSGAVAHVRIAPGSRAPNPARRDRIADSAECLAAEGFRDYARLLENLASPPRRARESSDEQAQQRARQPQLQQDDRRRRPPIP